MSRKASSEGGSPDGGGGVGKKVACLLCFLQDARLEVTTLQFSIILLVGICNGGGGREAQVKGNRSAWQGAEYFSF